MRVLQVIPAVASRYGGPSQAIVGIGRGLHARGVETLIATTNADGPGVLPVPTGVVTSFEGLDAIFFPRRGEAFKYSGALARWLRNTVHEFDVVHIHAVFSHSSLAAGQACRQDDVPYVVRPLGSLDPWALSRKAWKKRLLLGTAVKALVGGAAAVHFMTDEERRLAGPVTGTARSVVIPPGVDESFLAETTLPSAQRNREVVALTRLHPVKRLEWLIQSFHAATSGPELSEWRLSIAGDGDADYRADLERLAAAGPAAGRIRFAGWLEGDEKRRLLRHASLLAVPSFQENFGLGLIEALASGVPAVVSRGVNLWPDIESAGAGWVAGPDEADFQGALTTGMRDADDRERRSLAARLLAARFTWAATAAKLDALYESVRPLPVGGRH